MDLDPIVNELRIITGNLSGVKARQEIIIGIGAFCCLSAIGFGVWTVNKFDETTKAIHDNSMKIQRLEDRQDNPPPHPRTSLKRPNAAILQKLELNPKRQI